MAKKCIICGEQAEFRIKDVNDFYCRECAETHFGDISLLISVEEEARKLKKYIDSIEDRNNKKTEEGD